MKPLSSPCRRLSLSFVVVLSCFSTLAEAAQRDAAPTVTSKAPRWDARGLGPLPRMGVTSLDVSDDGKEIVVGTFAAPGDPNVIVLDAAGKIVRTYMVGQRGINQVAFLPASREVLAVCTMPAGRAGDRPEVFRCVGKEVVPDCVKQEGPWFFHYGDHSNHPTLLVARARNATAILAGNTLVIHRKDRPAATIRVPANDPDASLSLAVDDAGWAVVGTTTRESAGGSNLHLCDPDKQKPVWSRHVNKEVAKASLPEKGTYGTPTFPDGTRKELRQREERVWAPLSVAIHSSGDKRLIAAADYQGWQRWVFSSATMKEDNQGLRFMPTKPSITVFDGTGKLVKRFSDDRFKEEHWCDLAFSDDGRELHFSPHQWSSRGLGGQAVRLADDDVNVIGRFDLAAGECTTHSYRKHLSDQALSKRVQRLGLEYRVHYEHGVFVGDFNGDGKPDLAVFGYTNTGVGAGGPPAVYLWLQEARP